MVTLGLCLGGCGGEVKEPPAPVEPVSTGNGVIRGTVSFDGDVIPPSPTIQMNADPNCARMHAEPVLNEVVVVGEGNGLGNAFVYVKEGLEGKSFAPPEGSLTLDQQGCLYHPHVLGVRAGQTLRIVNSDDTLHNIHAFATKNKEFNIGQPVKGLTTERAFDVPEVMIPVRCDVHKWMASYLGVVDHPFFAVTASNGQFELAGLPAGSYLVEAWHEQYGTRQASVTLGDGETGSIAFSFGAE
jgi:plastocyanin